MKIEFAVIGTNVITDKFLEAAKTVEDFHLKGVYSRSKEKALAYAQKHGAELIFDDLDELAACDEIAAVYIASPNSFHAPQSIQMLKAKKHVLCEKPIASNSKELTKMKETALENNVILLEALRSEFSPGFAAIKENMYKLGTIRRVSFQYCQYSSRYDKFKQGIIENAFNPEFSNGALMDIGVYCVHPMIALFGKPDTVISSSLKLSNGVDGAGTILLEYEEMQGELLYSKITNSKVPSQIQGENGSMVIQEIQNPEIVTIYYKNGETEQLDIPKVDNNMFYETEAFIRLIEEKEFNHDYLKNSLMEIELMDEVRKQQEIVFPADSI